ncbi:MAG: segregation and condensation protein A [Pikeienuella sp.]|uniref:segregation and condensation protein A n=1 Tax=Pikeienuella sp. TaxID=2831957 RepID=UPI00391BF196
MRDQKTGTAADFETPARSLLTAPHARGEAPEALLVDVDGFEGPLDLLLALARSQRVDLRRVSILQLAEQYLAFVAAARRLRIELAADYLVMAAWLAWLKSRLLLPPPDPEEGQSAEDMAAELAWRLERLEAMRNVGARLMARDQLGRDRFARGEIEAVETRREVVWTATLADLLKAYARVKTKESYEPLHFKRPPVYALDEAVKRLSGLVGCAMDWTELSAWLPAEWLGAPERRRSAAASCFAASLELVKRGEAELRQDEAFGPLRLRARRRDAARA